MLRRSRLSSGTLQWLLAASACAGTPTEAGPTTEDTSGATEFPETSSSTMSATSLETSVSTSASTSMEVTSEDPTTTTMDSTQSTDTTSPVSDASSSGDTTTDPSLGTSSEDTNAESSTGEAAGGCLGVALRDVDPAECSIDSNTEAELTVTNNCAFEIDVSWIDYDCVENPWFTVMPDQTIGAGSYSSHPWRVRNAENDDLILEIPGLDGDTMVTVD